MPVSFGDRHFHFILGNPVLWAGSESIGFAVNNMNVKTVDLSINLPPLLKGGRGGFSGMAFKIPLNPPLRKGDFKSPSIGQIKATSSGRGFFTMPCFVYILRSIEDGSYYIGSTQDLLSRLERHNQGRSGYTKSNRPWELIYHEEYPNRSSAMKREKEIKKRKSREFIEALIETSRQP